MTLSRNKTKNKGKIFPPAQQTVQKRKHPTFTRISTQKMMMRKPAHFFFSSASKPMAPTTVAPPNAIRPIPMMPPEMEHGKKCRVKKRKDSSENLGRKVMHSYSSWDDLQWHAWGPSLGCSRAPLVTGCLCIPKPIQIPVQSEKKWPVKKTQTSNGW